MNPLRYLLLPFSLLYAAIIELRNLLYDLGLFRSYKAKVPVISVGNITAGGTGKTPFVIYLGRLLQSHGKRIAVVSRGYGRVSRGLLRVSDGQKILVSPQQGGDEPWLIARRLPDAVVVVAEKRREAIQAVEKNADVIILDDGFQHRAAARDLDIVLISRRQPWRGNFILPVGTLREPKYRLKRADLIVETHSDQGRPRVYSSAGQTVPSRFETSHLLDISFGHHEPDILRDASVFIFAAIAQPASFAEAVSRHGAKVAGLRFFRDHAAYTVDAIEHVLRAAEKARCRMLVCTEKDLVKLAADDTIVSLIKATIPVYALSGNVVVDEPRFLREKLKSLLDINV